MDIGNIFTRSWEVFWKHKILWVFGILSIILGAVPAVFSVFTPNFSDYDVDGFSFGGFPYSENINEFIRWADENTAVLIIGITLVVFVFIFLSLLLTTYSSTAIIQGNLRVDKGAEKLTFSDLNKSIRPYFWRVVGLNALLGVGSMGLVFGLMAILLVFSIFTLGLGTMCFSPLMIILAPAMWYLSIVVTQAMIAIIVEDIDIKEALILGWNLVKDKIGPFLLVWLIVMVISMVVSFAMYIPAMIAAVPIYADMFLSVSAEDPSSFYQFMDANMTFSTILSLVYILVMGIMSVFTTSIWVQTYLEARDDGTLEAPDQPEEAGLEPESLEQTT